MSHQQQAYAWLALGSNQGERGLHLVAAIEGLREFVEIDRISSIYETEPVGYLEQPRFFNLACSGYTKLPPLELLSRLKALEVQLGRQPNFRNGPRIIDIDILFYEDITLQQETLTIPHPRLHERAFVLWPLAEIAPTLRHPLTGQTIEELAASIPHTGIIKVGPLGGNT